MLCHITRTEFFTDDIFAVTLARKDGGIFDFKAGQYAVIGLPDAPEHDARPYSIASNPQTAEISFHIKSAGRGISGELAAAEKGMAVEIDMPHGAAWYRPESRPLLLVGGGLGLAPLLAIATEAEKINPGRKIFLYHGAYSANDLYQHDQLAAKAAQNEHFQYTGVTEAAADNIPQGRIGEFTAGRHDDLSGFDAYLSGPPAMVSHCFSLLQDKGLDPARTFSDALHHEIRPFAQG